jgi:hypothetical protein
VVFQEGVDGTVVVGLHGLCGGLIGGTAGRRPGPGRGAVFLGALTGAVHGGGYGSLIGIVTGAVVGAPPVAMVGVLATRRLTAAYDWGFYGALFVGFIGGFFGLGLGVLAGGFYGARERPKAAGWKRLAVLLLGALVGAFVLGWFVDTMLGGALGALVAAGAYGLRRSSRAPCGR